MSMRQPLVNNHKDQFKKISFQTLILVCQFAQYFRDITLSVSATSQYTIDLAQSNSESLP